MKLSKQIDQYKYTKSKIINYFTSKKTPDIVSVTDYAVNSGTPLIVIYYHINKELDFDFKSDIIRLAKFYGIKVDLEL